jgi:hypothetical protein
VIAWCKHRDLRRKTKRRKPKKKEKGVNEIIGVANEESGGLRITSFQILNSLLDISCHGVVTVLPLEGLNGHGLQEGVRHQASATCLEATVGGWQENTGDLDDVSWIGHPGVLTCDKHRHGARNVTHRNLIRLLKMMDRVRGLGKKKKKKKQTNSWSLSSWNLTNFEPRVCR